MAELPERKELIEYLPPFMQKFAEIRQITGTEDVLISDINESLGRALDNAFIETADEYGIKKYEAFVKRTHSPGESLDYRRTQVLLRWNDHIPYTYRVLIRKLNAFCGVNNYDIEADLPNYYIKFKVYYYENTDATEISKFIDRIIPANIFFDMETDSRNISMEIGPAAGMVMACKMPPLKDTGIDHEEE